MPNKTYRLYPKAVEDLESIYLYSVREFGTQRSDDYIFALEESFQYLANDSLLSRSCDYIRPELRAFNLGSHVIFIKITNYGISVVRILHQSMDFGRHV